MARLGGLALVMADRDRAQQASSASRNDNSRPAAPPATITPARTRFHCGLKLVLRLDTDMSLGQSAPETWQRTPSGQASRWFTSPQEMAAQCTPHESSKVSSRAGTPRKYSDEAMERGVLTTTSLGAGETF